MMVYLSDGERGGERHFVGKAEAETVKKGDVLKINEARGGGFAISLLAK